MKALKDCKWHVEIIGLSNAYYYWTAETFNYTGLTESILTSEKKYKRKINAIKAWKIFAKLNGITNYDFIQ